MEFLKKLFGEGESLTFEQLLAKIEADKSLKIVDLGAGGYIAKDKYDNAVATRDTQIKGLKDQLTEASTTIQSYKDMDVDGIKKSAADWQEKYTTETKKLQDQLDAQQTEFAAKTYLGGFHYANDLVKEAVYAKFMAKGFQRDGDKFVGADSFMEEMQKAYPTGFTAENPGANPPAQNNPPQQNNPAPQNQPGTPAQQQPRPWFAPPAPPAGPTHKRTLTEWMRYKNEHPDAKVNFDE